MQRPSLWLTIVVLLGGVLFLREPRLQESEDIFLRWLVDHTQVSGPPAPLTVIDIGSEELVTPGGATQPPASPSHVGASAVSPLEMALFLQAAMDFKPALIAFENVLRWRERDKDQEQVFIDQAMRVPRLLLATELTATPDPDNPGPDMPGFTQVTGKRGDLIEFSGIGRGPSEDVRLISTAGFANIPDEVADGLRVPLLFRYRGEVIPAFALEALLVWLRVTPSEVKIYLGSHISLPEGRRIPIASDGTMLIAASAARHATHMSLNDLLLAAEQRDHDQQTTGAVEMLRDQIVLARTPANPLSPPDIFASAIASMQTNRFVHRISMIFDCVFIVCVAVIASMLQKWSRVDVTLAAIAFSAGYCLLAMGCMTRWELWLPGVLPLGSVWLLVVAAPLLSRRGIPRRARPTVVPPPIA